MILLLTFLGATARADSADDTGAQPWWDPSAESALPDSESAGGGGASSCP